MRAPLLLLVLAPLIVCAPAQAEFLLVPSPDPVSTDAAAPAIRPHKPQTNVLRAPQDSPLQGFGHRIPLTFAARQIVPAYFQVAFADAVQKDAAVDWKGGDSWRETLAKAVRPLGLVITVRGPKVTIAAASAR
ncbi:MAG TPA: hypothetical protein VFE60_24420 [Roseiarcus sp.]|nr:hypothetical protein [Roseiarcus sp.]